MEKKMIGIFALLLGLLSGSAEAQERYIAQYGTASTFYGIKLYDVAGLELKTDAAYASGDVKVSKAGAADANAAAGFTADGLTYYWSASASEMTSPDIRVCLIDQGTKLWIDKCFNIETCGNSAAKYLSCGGGSGSAGAFVANSSLEVFNSSVSGVVTNTTSSTVRANGSYERFIGGKAWLNADYQSGTGTTLSVTLQHSPDGTNWINYGTFTQVGTADTVLELELSTPIYSNVRVNYSTTGTSPVYAFSVQLLGYIRR